MEDNQGGIPIAHVGDELKEFVKTAWRAGVPLFIWGPPGIGKSFVSRQAARELGEELDDENFGFLDIRLAQMDAAEVSGFPTIEKDEEGNMRMRYATPAMYPNDGNGLVVFDEMPAADQLVQVAGYKFAEADPAERGGNDYKLPEGWVPIFCGNRAEDNANVGGVSSALRMRCLQVTAVPKVEEWKKWAYRNRIHPAIIGFLDRYEQYLDAFNPASDEIGATPRTWHLISSVLQVTEPTLETVASAVGSGAASEFMAFLKIKDEVPPPEELLRNKSWYPDRERMDLAYATISSLSMHLIQMDDESFANAVDDWMEYLSGWPNDFKDLLVTNFYDVRSNRPDMPAKVAESKKADALLEKHSDLAYRIQELKKELS